MASGSTVSVSGTMPLLIIDVTANPSSVVQTNISSSSAITVKAYLQNGQPFSYMAISLSALSPGSISSATVTTDSNGQATAQLTPQH